ncbi:MAG TPA: methyltransferase, partial [Caldilineaceae bacterium]|nr:methyltransferase [Caldilineaceae bacterium]
GPALDIWGGPAFRIVLAAIRLNVIVALDKGPATASALAHMVQIDAHGAAILLEALRTLGYVQRRGEQYELTAMSRKWLTDGGESNLSAHFQYWGIALEKLFPSLEESIRSGQAQVKLYEWLEHEPEASRYFQEGLIALTKLSKDQVVKQVALPAGARRLLDVGGGHALYSVAFCHKYPQLSAVILDGPQALATGRATIAAEGLTGRITTQPGNFVTDALGEGYDAILLFNIVHGFTPEGNLALLRKVRQALTPGGRIYLLEQIAGAGPSPLQETIVQLLNVSFFHLLGGQVYPFAEIRTWLEEAGYHDI